MDIPTVTIICASVSGLVVNLLQYAREGRQHRWQMEQSARDQAERTDIAAGLTARAHAGVVTLSTKIDANTEISKAAFHEANNANMKIAAAIEASTLGNGRRQS